MKKIPAEIKTDNGSAFKFREFSVVLTESRVKLSFCTPYIHNAIGTVERSLRTLQDYLKVFLIEDNNLKRAVRRATLTLRKTISKSTGKTPFGIHFGRKHRSILTNVIDLENGAKDIVENLYDLRGNHLVQNTYSAKQLKQMEFDRRYGKTCTDKDLEHERLKRAVSTNFFVMKNHDFKGLESRFELNPKRTVTETDHTVSDGKKTYHKKDIADVTELVINNPSLLQGKVTAETKFKKIGRTEGGKFGKLGEPGVESAQVPVVKRQKKSLQSPIVDLHKAEKTAPPKILHPNNS